MNCKTSCGNDILVNTGCLHQHEHVKDYRGFKSDTITTFVDNKSGVIVADLNNADQYASIQYVDGAINAELSGVKIQLNNDLVQFSKSLECKINCVAKNSSNADEALDNKIDDVAHQLDKKIDETRIEVMKHSDFIDHKLCESMEHIKVKSIEGDQKIIAEMRETDEALDKKIDSTKVELMKHSDFIDHKLCEMIEHNKVKSIEGDVKIINDMKAADEALDDRIAILEEKAPVWDAKQDKLVPSSTISIDDDNNIFGNYEAGFGLKLDDVEFSADTDVMATREFVEKAIDDIEIVKFVSRLPEVGDPSFIYSVKKSGELLPGENTREEYVWHHDEWEKLGNGSDRLFREFDKHRHDADKHVTAEDKKAWNEHLSDKDIHVTVADKEKWTAKQDALTVPQIHAINSGIDAHKVKTYDEYEEKKQDKLIPGPGISIAGSVISTTAHENFDKFEKETHQQFDEMEDAFNAKIGKLIKETHDADDALDDRITEVANDVDKVNHLIASDVESKITNNKLAIEELKVSKQNKLYAGANIRIDGENTISAICPVVDLQPLRDKDVELNNRLEKLEEKKEYWDAKQTKLIAGKNIHIESNGTIDAIINAEEIFEAGKNIEIIGNRISAVDTTYKAGTGIVINEDNRISVADEVATDAELDAVKAALEDKIESLKTNFELFEYAHSLDAIPTPADPNKIYLVPANPTDPENKAQFDEYIWNKGWELIGQLQLKIDLTPYAKQADVDNIKEDLTNLKAECEASRYTAGKTIEIVENKINWALADKIYADKNKDNKDTIMVKDNITVSDGGSIEVDKIIFRSQSGARYAYYVDDDGVFRNSEIK